MFDVEQENIERLIREYCQDKRLPDINEIPWSPIPFSGEWGISTSFFKLAAQEARTRSATGEIITPVPKRAQEIAEEISVFIGQPEGFSRVEAVNGYLNLYFVPAGYSNRVIDHVLDQTESYGCGPSKNKMVMVEFSQPNTHKAFHVGHLRSAILGDTLCRILSCAGFDVVRANYYGDIGLHVIKWLWNYKKHHNGELPPEDTTRWMGDLYAEAVKRIEEEPELEGEVRELYSLWDQDDPEIVELWRQSRKWSLDGFNDIYT